MGNKNELITGLNGIVEAEKGDIAFLANPKYKDFLLSTKASAVIVGTDIEASDLNLLRTTNPRLA
ncbi:MAG: UDP-3-O-(3-hydroxymyristoyl)glucosamine N-acyltransferase, partial [Desulfobacterales bacterium]|nr:UDP-3-O-(3-hydroxymyristoyl)glucosamine N-acyltransferase [Desulfobacterales bacterium]